MRVTTNSSKFNPKKPLREVSVALTYRSTSGQHRATDGAAPPGKEC